MLKALATAGTREDAAAKRASILAQRATNIGAAHQVGLERFDSYTELIDAVDIDEDSLKSAADSQLEAETDLDAEALRERNAARSAMQRATTRAPGQPSLELGARTEPTTRKLHRVLVESETEQVGTDAALRAQGLDPEYVAEAADQTAGTVAADELEAESDDDKSPARPDAQAQTGLRLAHVDELPATADVVLEDIGPRISEWLGEWTEETLADASATLREILSDHHPGILWRRQVPLTMKRRLRQEYGIVATDGLQNQYAEVLTEYSVDATHAVDDTRREQFETALFGIGDPDREAYDGLDTFARGPLQVLGYRDPPVETVVQLDTDAWLSLDDRETGLRAIKALGAIAESSRVYLGYDSVFILEMLADRFGDYLEMGGASLVEERDAALERRAEDAPKLDTGDARRAYDWLAEQRDDTQPVRLLKTLSRAPDSTLTREEILSHEDVEITANSFYAAKDRLTGASLARWESRRGRNQASRLSLTHAGKLAATHIDDEWAVIDPLEAAGETNLGAPHIATPSTVGSRGTRTKGGDGPSGGGGGGGLIGRDPRSAETWLAKAAAAGFSDSTPDEDGEYVHYLNGPGGSLGAFGMHRRLTAPATEPGVHLVDERIENWNDTADSRATFISDLEVRDGEFLVVAQAAVDPLVTLARLATTLLDNRVLAGILTESELGREFEQVYAGAWDTIEDVEQVDDLHEVLRDGVQVGWKSADERTVEEYRDRLRGLRRGVLTELASCTALDRGEERRKELFEDLHGIIASMTQLLFASGRHVVFNLRVPETRTLLNDETARQDLLNLLRFTVPKQAVFHSETGWHSWYRQTKEHREEKLKWRRPPGLEDSEPEATLTASWVVSGPSITEFETSIRRAVDTGVRERADGKRAPPALEVPVRDATQPHVLAEVIEDVAGEKDYDVAMAAVDDMTDRDGPGTPAEDCDYDPDAVAVDDDRADDITRLLRVCLGALGTADRPLAASPFAVAEALLYTAKSDRISDYLRVRDLEYGLSQLPPSELFPELGRVATSFVQVLLAADEPLRPAEIIERSVSTADTRRSWENAREELLTLGIVEERAAGQHQHYTATLEPWWTPATPSSRPPNVDESMVARDREHEMLFELSVALGLEVDDELFAWTGIEPPSTDAIYNAAEQLRRWRPMLSAVFADREDLIDLPPPQTEAVVLGRDLDIESDHAESQQSLSSSAQSGEKLDENTRRESDVGRA